MNMLIEIASQITISRMMIMQLHRKSPLAAQIVSLESFYGTCIICKKQFLCRGMIALHGISAEYAEANMIADGRYAASSQKQVFSPLFVW